MSIVAVVHAEVQQDHDDGDYEEDHAPYFRMEFTSDNLLDCLKACLETLEDQGLPDFQLLNDDHVLALLEHGGDLDADDALRLAEELEQIAETLAELDIDEDDRSEIETFLEEMTEVVSASEQSEGSIEFFNFEDSVVHEDDDEPEEEADEEEEGEDDPAKGGAAALFDVLMGGLDDDLEEDEPDDEFFLNQDGEDE